MYCSPSHIIFLIRPVSLTIFWFLYSTSCVVQTTEWLKVPNHFYQCTWEHLMSLSRSFLQMKAQNQNFPKRTRIWLGNWHLRSRINLWCEHKFTNVVLSLCWHCWQMSMLTVWHFWSAYFDQHLPLQKSSCTPNN